MIPSKTKTPHRTVTYLLRRGRRRHGQYLTIMHITPQHSSHRGVHISKKVHKSAVRRNAAKRAIYQLLQDLQSADNICTYFVMINKRSLDSRINLVESDSSNNIYKKVYNTLTPDIKRFISSLS